jgi:hypothetical protein
VQGLSKNEEEEEEEVGKEIDFWSTVLRGDRSIVSRLNDVDA